MVVGILVRVDVPAIDVKIWGKFYPSNPVGSLQSLESIEWAGQKDFIAAALTPWMAGGHVAGETKSSKGLLTWATINGGGHMVRGHSIICYM